MGSTGRLRAGLCGSGCVEEAVAVPPAQGLACSPALFPTVLAEQGGSELPSPALEVGASFYLWGYLPKAEDNCVMEV